MVSMIRQKPREEHLTDEKDVQKHFVGHAVMQFISSQRISVWWNSATHNNQCSEVFNAALLAILIGDFKEAERLRLKATFGFIKWPIIASIIAAICLSFIPFIWIALAVLVLMLVRRFSWLLYAEAMFLCKVLGATMPKPDDQNWPFAFIPMNPGGGRYRRFIQGVAEKLPKSRILAKTYADFAEFCDREEGYARLPVKNCAVCATMSAGKSTFINALLGKDVLPSRNGAATAKVTSVYDKDGARGLAGFAWKKSGGFTDVFDDVDVEKLGNWNDDENISRIFLQGDLDGIANRGFKVVVHDTPGTNNSGDDRHHSVTAGFLRATSPDVVVYVANAEQLCTTDEKFLLSELCEYASKKQSVKFLFVLNKADSIDTGKENIASLIERYKGFLSETGFAEATICPVSSKAARLVKMALKGKAEQFSESERDDFPIVVRRFTKRLALGSEVGRPQQAADGDSQVLVDGESYSAALLHTALAHTGILGVEAAIEKIMTSSRQ